VGYLEQVIIDANAAGEAIARGASRTRSYNFIIPNDCEKIKETIEELGKFKESIYVISVAAGSGKTFKDGLVGFKSETKRACPRINKCVSDILYVGSSSSNPRNRLLQHLSAAGHSKTYALHLKCWAEGSVNVLVEEYEGVGRRVLQLIEDAKSYDLQPIFGKQGGNGR